MRGSKDDIWDALDDKQMAESKDKNGADFFSDQSMWPQTMCLQ